MGTVATRPVPDQRGTDQDLAAVGATLDTTRRHTKTTCLGSALRTPARTVARRALEEPC
jgi:hypothetical protein